MKEGKKIAFITGITGQDGSYLAEFLLEKGYDVWGLELKGDTRKRENLAEIAGRIQFVSGDLDDEKSIFRAIKKILPDEVYNLAAQSSSAESF